MVGDILQPTHLLLVLVVALLVLGPKRLPEVARHLGSGIRDFRDAISGEQSDRTTSEPSRQVEPDTAAAETMQTQAPADAMQTHAPAETMQTQAPADAMQTHAPAETMQTQAPADAMQTHAPAEAMQTQAVVAEPQPAHTAAVQEPETQQADAVVAEPNHEPDTTPADAVVEPDHTEAAAPVPLAAPEHAPAPAPDSADPATTELSSERPT